MPAYYTDPCDNVVGQLTNQGRTLSTRAAVEGLSFKFYGWAIGLGGYLYSNPVHIIAIDPTMTSLIQQIYPATGQILYTQSDLEFPNERSIALSMRVVYNTFAANYGIGEFGSWVQIINSPNNPSENGQIQLFAVGHSPIQCLTANTTSIRRMIVNF